MEDVHLPRLDEHDEHDAAALPAAARPPRTPSIVRIALEVVLIGTGVFLGLAGEQWRESMRHRELADASLRRFRTEILANRKAVAAVKDYHARLQTSIDAYLSDPTPQHRVEIRVTGVAAGVLRADGVGSVDGHAVAELHRPPARVRDRARL